MNETKLAIDIAADISARPEFAKCESPLVLAIVQAALTAHDTARAQPASVADHLSRAAEPVYQFREPQAVDDVPWGGWIDCTADTYLSFQDRPKVQTRILYTHPPEPARDAKDMRAMVRRAMNAEWCGRIMADCLLVGTDYGEEMMEAALKAAMAEESRNG